MFLRKKQYDIESICLCHYLYVQFDNEEWSKSKRLDAQLPSILLSIFSFLVIRSDEYHSKHTQRSSQEKNTSESVMTTLHFDLGNERHEIFSSLKE
jgi:hypothetical protein